MHWYRIDFTFSNGGSSYVNVFSPERIADPTPFDLVDFYAADIDLLNILMMKVNYIGCEIN